MALGRVLAIQDQANRAAAALGRPLVDMINAEEEARIRELVALKTWPQGWTGREPRPMCRSTPSIPMARSNPC